MKELGYEGIEKHVKMFKIKYLVERVNDVLENN
jgi:hypothetical protein